MSHKLLLADDSVTIQRVIELTFSGEEIDVLAVSDGEQAIARIAAERPDIVLADIGMPKRNGYEVAAFIKSDPALKHIPVLLLAGAFEPVDDARAAEVGCDGVLVKPFEPQHVIARVRELLNGKKGAPARATADVARPVERLALRAEEPVPVLAPVPLPTPLPARAEAPPALAPQVVEERVLPRPIEFPRREEQSPPPPVIDRDSVDAFDFAEAATASGETAGPRAQGADESLDEYFDRLDAAFATLSGVPMPHSDRPDDERAFDDRLDVPTLDDLLGSDYGTPSPSIDLPLHTPTVTPFTPRPLVAPPTVEPPDVSPTRAPAAAEWRREPQQHVANPAPAPASDRVVANAFTALLAVEQGEPGAAPVRLTSAPAEPVITEAFLNEVVRRVVERLSPGAARDVITEIVSKVAERLVREEIERIRKRQ